MNAVEIEEAVSTLAEAPFEAEEFPYAFLEAFGNKATTIKKLRSGASNKSDVPGGVLQRNNIHLAVAPVGEVGETLKALRDSSTTTSQKAKYIFATDGQTVEAENLTADGAGETLACPYDKLGDHFAFFLTLAGISTVKAIRDNAFDIKATGRLNKLYVELLRENPDWDSAERREDLNHFFARLIFCFFAEDTSIFHGEHLFTATIEQMSNPDNVHEVLAEIFRAMDTKAKAREAGNFRPWANQFPYVNGGLFKDCVTGADVPRFTRIARSYLIHVGHLDWTQINPDIFGSMIQAVADDEERGALGMHYTSVPNILKVLNPLFLDELNEKLEEAGDGSDTGSKRKLLNLRNRLTRIRVFDPACGSGNFLVIAYKEMRKIEAEINRRRDEADKRTEIPLTNFRGIELRHFACEIARLALVIAEFQCDALHRGETLARAEFLPLDQQNWITHGNALRIDWLTVCPPTGMETKRHTEDLFETSLDQAEIDFENEGGETYICGNPPYKGSNWRTKEQTADLGLILSKHISKWKALDFVTGWLFKASTYSQFTKSASAFVVTNSVCQGVQASLLWPLLTEYGQKITFAHKSFKWSNLASNNAGVSVIVIGLSSINRGSKKLIESDADGKSQIREVSNINAYLLNAPDIIIYSETTPIGFQHQMTDGSGALDGQHLIMSSSERANLIASSHGKADAFIRPYLGSSEFIRGNTRWCLWIDDDSLPAAKSEPQIEHRIQSVKQFRENAGTRAKTALHRPHKFAWINKADGDQILIPTVFSEKREYVTAGYFSNQPIINNAASIVQDADLYVFSIISSKLHIDWVRAVAGRLKTDLRYTAALCFNTFPIPTLTEQNIADLTRCSEDILLARESYWPATIAEMYDPDRMDKEFPDLHAAHERNDETLERIYIGRRFKNETERLEKLFDMYTKMTAKDRAKK